MGKQPDAEAGETSAAIAEDAETERAAGSPPHTQEPEPQDSENDKASETELQAKLSEYEAQIAAEETKLAAIKAEINSLSAVKASVTRNQQLAKIYSSMRPDSAASILCKLEEAVSIQILTQMDNRTSGKIMDAIADTDPHYAAKISKLMVENQ
jgi:flagellar motility protein MotE (MotC chaperone)